MSLPYHFFLFPQLFCEFKVTWMEKLSTSLFPNFEQLFLKFMALLAEHETTTVPLQLVRAQSFLSFYKRKGKKGRNSDPLSFRSRHQIVEVRM